jgi:hypothetical protein
MRIPKPLAFDWDEGNRKKNQRKHNVSVKECEEVFTSGPIFLRDKNHSQYEERFYAFGRTTAKRPLTVVFTIRDEKIRVISARDQNKKERVYINMRINKISNKQKLFN